MTKEKESRASILDNIVSAFIAIIVGSKVISEISSKINITEFDKKRKRRSLIFIIIVAIILYSFIIIEKVGCDKSENYLYFNLILIIVIFYMLLTEDN